MSYCRWLEGDLYAYASSDRYIVHVAAPFVRDGVRDQYEEATACALLGRILWLGSKGCTYPLDAIKYLSDDIVEEIEAREIHGGEVD